MSATATVPTADGWSPKLVIAVDFGTHGTGFAWSRVSPGNDAFAGRRVDFHSQWPGAGDVTYPKNRTALLVTPNDELVAWGHAAVSAWRRQAPESTNRLVTNFKMALQPDRGPALGGNEFPPDPGGGAGPAATPPSRERVRRLIVLCLRAVKEVASDRVLQGVYDADDVRWCLTVPAIWDQSTRDLMRGAAVEAGFPNDRERFVLVQEPTAAAMHCIRDDDRLGQPGTRFMVVDAGGGTVDITSYTVGDLAALDELARPSGVKRGAEYLDQTFLDVHVTRALDARALARVRRTHQHALRELENRFSDFKRSFDVHQDDEFYLPLPRDLYDGLRSVGVRGLQVPSAITVTGADLAALFDEVIADIVDAIGRHLAEMRSRSGVSGGELVVLVGGFARSPYLRARLREYVRGRGAELVVPQNPEIAVLGGAVHYAYGQRPRSQRSPYTYALQVSAPFEEGDPPESKRRTEQGLFSTDRTQVLVSSGQSLAPDTAVPFGPLTPIDSSLTELPLTLVATTAATVRYWNESGTRVVGTCKVDIRDLSHLPLAQRAVWGEVVFGLSEIWIRARVVATGKLSQTRIRWRQV